MPTEGGEGGGAAASCRAGGGPEAEPPLRVEAGGESRGGAGEIVVDLGRERLYSEDEAYCSGKKVCHLAAFLLVLCSGLAHALWNLFTKKSRNKNAFLWLIHVTSFLLLLPLFVRELANASLPPAAYGFLALSMAFQMGYCLLLPVVYERGDMSQSYPVMRGTGALLVPLFSIWLYQETLSLAGWAGIGCIVLGLFAISGTFSRRLDRAALRPLVPAFAVGLCITGYVLTDKTALTWLSPVAMIELSNLAYLLVLTPTVLGRGLIGSEWKANWRTIALGSVFSPGSYLLFLLAVQLAPLSHLAPVREVGTVFGTLLGVLLLKEAQPIRRVVLSFVITAGVISVGLWGNG
ncbi:membrane protein [Paenibacillus sp. J31TS4]|uniref:DMT family transporter n=1 Tax=Paenibacillus sp. J31TS4 TaxID=2807195 RepID=UPI001B1A5B2A|nr:DMT family transporter [Paenibacillus sp. J31TS4]GIP40128.1 membrane protein [Paenibacillus sp. J31TS4]